MEETVMSCFWGPVTATDWCEKNYKYFSFIMEFYNTMSNVPGILLAFVSLLTAVRQHFEKRFSVLHISNIILAVGSMIYHATLQRVMQQSDETPTVWEMLLYLYVLYSPDWHYGSTMSSFLFLYSAVFAIVHVLVRLQMLFKLHYATLYLLCIPRMFKYYMHTADAHANRLVRLFLVTFFLGSSCGLFDRFLCKQVTTITFVFPRLFLIGYALFVYVYSCILFCSKDL